VHARVPDDAGWYGSSRYRIRPCCLLLPHGIGTPEYIAFAAHNLAYTHSLPGSALPPYRGRSFTGRNASASPDAPELKVRSLGGM